MPELPEEDLIWGAPTVQWSEGRGARAAPHPAPSGGQPALESLYPETLAAIYGEVPAGAVESPGEPLLRAPAGAAGGSAVAERRAAGPGAAAEGRALSPRAAPQIPAPAELAAPPGSTPGPPLAFVRRGSPVPPAPPTPPAAPPPAAAASVQTAFLRQDEAGGMAFDIELEDAVLGPMTLTIAVHQGRATARLEVADVDARRLVDAEQGRLHAALQRRGLRVDALEVRVRAPDGR